VHDKEWQETFWMDESAKHKITISEVVTFLKEEPIVSIKLEDLAHIKDLSLHTERVESADLSCPIIVTEKDGRCTRILDGHHRRAKAASKGKDYICAKILRFSCIPVQFQWLAS